MSYYPIKCPYCLNEMSNNDICFIIGKNAATQAAGGRISISSELLNITANTSELGSDVGADVFDGFGSVDLDGLGDEDTFDGFDDADLFDGFKNENPQDESSEEPDAPTFDDDALLGKNSSNVGEIPPLDDSNRWKNVPHNIRETVKEEVRFTPLTIQHIKNVWGEDNVKIDNNIDMIDVDVSPVYKEEKYNKYSGKLIIGISVRESNRDEWKHLIDRYCPHCEDSKLHHNAGKMPSFVALLMGTSDAGKTVYLTSLYYSLSQGGGFKLPFRGVLSVSIADAESGIPIAQFADELFEHGRLPHTTTKDEIIPTPLALNISVSFGTSNTKALLYLRDISGENLISDNDRLRRIVTQFPKFDSFMFLLDPYTFPSSARIFSAWDMASTQGNIGQLRGLQNIISTLVSRSFANRISIPTTVLVTKGDIFFDGKCRGPLNEMGVKQSNTALANLPDNFGRLGKMYFSSINNGTKIILEKLNNSILHFVNDWFDESYFAVVSALGRQAVIRIEEKEDGTRLRFVENPNLIRPWRVAETMARLLMALNVLPPFDKLESPPPTEEPVKDVEKRKENNRKLINGWGNRYCANWDDI